MKHFIGPILLLSIMSAGAQAEKDPYGLLFTTPEQRYRLDGRSSGGNGSSPTALDSGTADTEVRRPLKLNGALVSSAGKKQVWINGESQLSGTDTPNTRVRLLGRDRVRVKPSTSGPAHDMKPGQILYPDSGTVSEAYDQAAKPSPQSGDTP